MTALHHNVHRWAQGNSRDAPCLQDKFEVLKDIGDGSFGSVALARVRGAGSHIAKRGTMVAIKTMKKTFDSFNQCLELREIIFLRTLPPHAHLVPALDIFLDPFSKKLHIAMEYMDGNLYQLIKTRDGKHLENVAVKSILYQIIAGLEHIHQNAFFHRDIKPENILVTMQQRDDQGSAFKRYSQIVRDTAIGSSSQQYYIVKLADFGLARETYSHTPYTTYVSTRWYRAPEVLLRAGEYSAPVDMWAIGAMAVEVALLKPLFPGSNEVDQVWRVCEIMGSPGNWVSKHGGSKVGGGPWKQGVKLAQKLGFTFPKMAPHTIDEFLLAPEWPAELCDFITWCLAWDPNARPTATDALHHQYFADAIDPLRPKSAASTRILGRKTPDIEAAATHQEAPHTLNNRRSSWFRRSLVARDSAPVVQQQRHETPRLASPPKAELSVPIATSATRPAATKRATWTVGSSQYGAPMPFLPAIKPISPMPNAVHAEAKDSFTSPRKEEPSATLSRQLSMLSQRTSTSDLHRQDPERVLNGRVSRSNLRSASASNKDGFFSHFRKRTRRSGMPATPQTDDLEAPQHATWHPTRQSMLPDLQSAMVPAPSQTDFGDIDNALRNIQYRLSPTKTSPIRTTQYNYGSTPILKRQSSKPLSRDQASNGISPMRLGSAASSLRANQRAMQRPGWFSQRRRAPSEQSQQQQQHDVATIDHALGSAAAAMARLEQQQSQYIPQPYPSSAAPIYRKSSRPNLRPSASTMGLAHKGPYPTPSPSTRHDGESYNDWANAVDMRQHEPQQYQQHQHHQGGHSGIPTPPYDEGGGNVGRAYDDPWAAAAAVAIAEAGQAWR